MNEAKGLSHATRFAIPTRGATSVSFAGRAGNALDIGEARRCPTGAAEPGWPARDRLWYEAEPSGGSAGTSVGSYPAYGAVRGGQMTAWRRGIAHSRRPQSPRDQSLGALLGCW